MRAQADTWCPMKPCRNRDITHEKLNFSTGGGFRKSSNTIGFQDQDGILGDANHFLLDSCPMVRSIGLDVEQNGLGFVWLPGSLPFLVRDPSKCHLNCVLRRTSSTHQESL